MWQGADYLSRIVGTLCRTSAGLSAEARPPAASSWCVRIPFTRLQPMSIPYIRVVFLRVPAFKILRASHRPLERWQSVDRWLPVRSLMAAVPCGHGTDRQKRTEDSYEYMHHCVRGLKLPMGTTEILITFRSKIRLNGFLMPLKRKKVLSLQSFSKQKNVFVQPNEQCQIYLSIAMARKCTFRGTRKEQ